MIDTSNSERQDIIQLLTFISGRPEVFYKNMTIEQLRKEYEQLRSVDEK